MHLTDLREKIFYSNLLARLKLFLVSQGNNGYITTLIVPCTECKPQGQFQPNLMQKHGDFTGAQFLQQTCKVSNQGSPLSNTSGSQTSGRQHVLIKYTRELQGSEKLLRHCAAGRIRDANSTAV